MTEATPVTAELAAIVLRADSPESQTMKFGRPDAAKGKESARVNATNLYDGLAVLYNEAEVDAMLVLSLPNNPSLGNLNRVLGGRGVVLDVDYRLFRAKYDVDGKRYPTKERPLVLEKLSPTPMKLRQVADRQSPGREIAHRAKEIGKLSTDLLHARDRRKEEDIETQAEQMRRDTGPLDGVATPLDHEELATLQAADIPPPRILPDDGNL